MRAQALPERDAADAPQSGADFATSDACELLI